MNIAIAALNKKVLNKVKHYESGKNTLNNIRKSTSLFLIATMFLAGSIVALLFNIPVKNVMSNYSYDVLVILIVM